MTYDVLCAELEAASVLLKRTDGGLTARPLSKITPALAAGIKEHKAALLAAPILAHPGWIVFGGPELFK